MTQKGRREFSGDSAGCLFFVIALIFGYLRACKQDSKGTMFLSASVCKCAVVGHCVVVQWRNVGGVLKAARTTSAVIKHQADEGLAVVDFVGVDEGESFRESEAEDFNIFVRFGGGGALADVSGQVDLHPFTEEARAGEVLCQQGPAFGAVAGLFDELAFRGGESGFVGFDAAGGKFDQREACGVAILTLEDDVGVAWVL